MYKASLARLNVIAMVTHKSRPIFGSLEDKVYRVLVGETLALYLATILAVIEWAFNAS